MAVSTVRGQRFFGGLGLGRTGGGGVAGPVSCAPNAQCGVCVRPAKGGGAREWWRWGFAATDGVGGPGLAPVTGNRTQSHTRAPKASWYENRCETIALPPPKRVERGALYRVLRLME